ncbi:helicase-like protein [Leishmania panamensis]|uniref:Helicase-like protein, putative n=1 Tax=Leishmania panamensis TaxID=5679 RepID=A0A088SG63_LEIPA|nr:helicase-like protein [Leishmania panamensis]AIO00802.1 helicase-like protein [Leishmania panamensis]
MMNRGALTLLLHRDVTIGEGGHWMKRLDCKLLRTLHKEACPRCLSITGTLLQNDLTELPRVLEYVGPQLSIHDDADQQPPREAVAALSRRWGLRVSEQREKKSCDNIGNREVTKRPAAVGGEERVPLFEYLQKGPQSFLLRRVKATVDIQLAPKYNGANPPPSHPAHTEAASVLRPGAIIRAPQQQPPHAPLRVLRAFVFSCVTSTLIRMKGCCTSHQPSSACERLSCIRKVSGTLKLLDVMRLKLRRRGPLCPLVCSDYTINRSLQGVSFGAEYRPRKNALWKR